MLLPGHLAGYYGLVWLAGWLRIGYRSAFGGFVSNAHRPNADSPRLTVRS